MQKYVIISADDFGLCSSINHASVDAMRQGCVSSLSIMPCGPKFNEAVRLAKKSKIWDMGVHLTLTSEFSKFKWKPVSDPKLVPSLCDKNGYFQGSIDSFAKYARTEEIAIELENQVLKVFKQGVIPTHLDSHMFALHSQVSKRKDLLSVILYLCKKYKLPFRCPFKKEYLFLKKHRVPALRKSFKETYDIILRDKTNKYNSFIVSIRGKLAEMILHCGYANKELQFITKYSKRRQADFDYAVSPQTRDLLKNRRVTLISWKEAGCFI